MEKILFALCEGPHDVAFLYRILRVNGLKKYSKTIGAFPPPLDIYFTKEAAGENLERLKLEEIRNRRLPSEVLSYGDNVLVLLYAIGGDSKVESRKRLLQDIGSMYGGIPIEKEIRTGATAECSVLYFFDADQKGIDVRLQEVCKELSEIMSSGKLVSDELIKKMLENKLTTLDKNKPFIMDGYPRTLDQVKDYEEILEKLGLNIGKAIYLKIDKETGLKRVLGRLTCPKCKKGYNKLTGYNMPKVEWICDDCKVELESRVDDTEEAYNIRYDTYMKETKPIIEYFKSKNNLIEIDSTQDADSTMKEIEKWLV